MIDKKYTDKDIISSLEVIATTCNCNECKIRSGRWGTCNCSETTANAALDLITRQKAEIDSLKSELDAAIKAITPCCLNCKHYKRNQFGDYGCLQKYEPSVTSRCANWKWIGVKEMVGDNNAE